VTISVPVTIKIAEIPKREFLKQRLESAVEAASRDRDVQRAVDAAAGRTAEERIDGLVRSITRQLQDDVHVIAEINELGELDVVPSRQAKVAKLLLTIAATRENEWEAIDALKKWADASCVPALIKLLESSDSHRGGEIAEVLGQLGDARAAEPIAEALAREGFGGHWYEEALQHLGPAAEPAVLPLLEHRDDHVRRSAIDVLAEVGGKQSVERLRKIVAENEGRFGFEGHSAERALEQIRQRQAGSAALAAVGGTPPQRPSRLTNRLSLEDVREVLADEGAGAGELQSALTSLAQIAPPDEATRKELAGLVERRLSIRGGAHVRGLALDALAKWGGAENEARLLTLLEQADGSERVALVQALQTAGGERTAQALVGLLRKHKTDRRLAPKVAEAVGATAARGGATAVQTELLRLLDSGDVVLRMLAATALGQLPGEGPQTALKDFIRKEPVTIAWVAAIESLGRHEAVE
jgi:HEAT repeat protein